MKNGTPGHPPTPLTQWYADNVVYYNGVAQLLKVGIDFDRVINADNFIRFNISLPTVYLNERDFSSAAFLKHVGLLAHEFWHAIQAFSGKSILKEVEAYNVQTLIGQGLGLMNWSPDISGLTTQQRMDLLSMGLPTPLGQGVTRDFCTLCRASCYLGALYADYALISEPIPVTRQVCRQYNCPVQC